jgi:cbb3-type cytochrome oxidase maturation protein
MTALAWLIPAALALGALGLVAFMWALRTGQYDDLDGAAWRALDDDPVSTKPKGPRDGEQ